MKFWGGEKWICGLNAPVESPGMGAAVGILLSNREVDEELAVMTTLTLPARKSVHNIMM